MCLCIIYNYRKINLISHQGFKPWLKGVYCIDNVSGHIQQISYISQECMHADMYPCMHPCIYCAANTSPPPPLSFLSASITPPSQLSVSFHHSPLPAFCQLLSLPLPPPSFLSASSSHSLRNCSNMWLHRMSIRSLLHLAVCAR